MKRIFLIGMTALVLTACGGNPAAKVEMQTDADGNRVSATKYSTTVFPEQLPVTLKYNDKEISVSDFVVYQEVVDYEHYLYAAVTVDASSLSDEDFHWLKEDDVINASAFVKGGENGIEDAASMTKLGQVSYTDSKQIKYGFLAGLHGTYKKAFDGSDISLMVDVAQEEGTPYGLYYSITPDTIKTVSQMSKEDKDFYEKVTAMAY